MIAVRPATRRDPEASALSNGGCRRPEVGKLLPILISPGRPRIAATHWLEGFPARRSFGPKSEWQACLILAVHEPVILFAKNAPVGASEAFEDYRRGNSPRSPCDLQLDLTNRFLRASVRTQTDVLDHKWAGKLRSSICALFGYGAAEFIFSKIASLPLELHDRLSPKGCREGRHRDEKQERSHECCSRRPSKAP